MCKNEFKNLLAMPMRMHYPTKEKWYPMGGRTVIFLKKKKGSRVFNTEEDASLGYEKVKKASRKMKAEKKNELVVVDDLLELVVSEPGVMGFSQDLKNRERVQL